MKVPREEKEMKPKKKEENVTNIEIDDKEDDADDAQEIHSGSDYDDDYNDEDLDEDEGTLTESGSEQSEFSENEEICREQYVFLLNTGFGNEEEQKRIKELLHVETRTGPDDSGNAASVVSWAQDDIHKGVRLKHFKTVSSVEWHRKGDYFSTVMPAGESRAILIHQLSKRLTQRLPFKLHGLPVSSTFHPTRSIFFISTKKNIRVYDLLKQKLIKKLETGLREVSSIAIHPGGDNVIVGSREGKLCWFDMDLSSKPYRVLKCHPKDVTSVAFHRSYPLFASCSDDCTAYVFHGMVYSDLNQNPLIVPLEILRGHASANGRG
ncbi:ribosome biogenesis protein BOP1 homolog [Camellia sinensis]|uniref:ribosome biogenesis protein BOP1 homolog n=1 Tax=Camellia sinensis TaxID=4442 RepID=UPI0010365D90|nr:ribosome biogenesis protein BOP1 homolog [Camellia sinensis]